MDEDLSTILAYTVEDIKQDVLSRLTVADTREGSYTNDVVSAVSYEMWRALQSLSTVRPMVYIDENSGAYIDDKCAAYGIYRKLGKKSKAVLTITGTDGTIIPEGRIFLTTDNLQFVTDEAVVIKDGTATITVTAAEYGEKYNVAAGEIYRQFVNLSGINAVSSSVAEGGIDPESNAALVGRYYNYLQSTPTSGNKAHYTLWALEVNGVSAARVYEGDEWEGGAGTVKVLVAGANGQPVSAAVVKDCAEHIEKQRPVGPEITVMSAEGRVVNISASVLLDTDTNLDTVKSMFSESLAAYISAVAFKEDTVIYNRIGHLLLGIPGVIDFSVLTLNGDTRNIVVSTDEVPVLGNMEVTSV